jgi:RimJ/RimL family protein N-acetyltransferase
MKIRKATREDLWWLLENGMEMLKIIDPNKVPNAVYLNNFVIGLLENGILFVAEKDGKITGMIGGVKHPNIYFPEDIDLTELFWWIPEKYRKTRASYMLMKSFTAYGKQEKVARIILSVLSETQLNADALEKRGYKFREAAYVMEVI